jgi:hypothetical protein
MMHVPMEISMQPILPRILLICISVRTAMNTPAMAKAG